MRTSNKIIKQKRGAINEHPMPVFYKKFTVSPTPLAVPSFLSEHYEYTNQQLLSADHVYSIMVGAPVHPIFSFSLESATTWPTPDWPITMLGTGYGRYYQTPLGHKTIGQASDEIEMVKKPIFIDKKYIISSPISDLTLVFFDKKIDVPNKGFCVGFLIHTKHVFVTNIKRIVTIRSPYTFKLSTYWLSISILSSRNYNIVYTTTCKWYNSSPPACFFISCNCPGWTRRSYPTRKCKHVAIMQSLIDTHRFIYD